MATEGRVPGPSQSFVRSDPNGALFLLGFASAGAASCGFQSLLLRSWLSWSASCWEEGRAVAAVSGSFCAYLGRTGFGPSTTAVAASQQ